MGQPTLPPPWARDGFAASSRSADDEEKEGDWEERELE